MPVFEEANLGVWELECRELRLWEGQRMADITSEHSSLGERGGYELESEHARNLAWNFNLGWREREGESQRDIYISMSNIYKNWFCLM